MRRKWHSTARMWHNVTDRACGCDVHSIVVKNSTRAPLGGKWVSSGVAPSCMGQARSTRPHELVMLKHHGDAEVSGHGRERIREES
jgi:hypothetical protein